MTSKAALEGFLLENAVLNQQLQLEASFLQQKSLHYQAACSQLSTQFTHTQSLLQVRSSELVRLRRKNAAQGKTLDLRKQAGRLERENEILREQMKSLKEGISLQAEIVQAQDLQRMYLEKLRELKEPGEEKGEGKHLKEVEEELLAVSKERDYFRNTVIPVLKQTIDLFEQHKTNLLGEIAELQEPASPQPPVLPLSPLAAAARTLCLSPRVGTTVLNPKTSSSRSSKASKPSVYSPSFLRTRRHCLKVKSRRDVPLSQPIAEIDEFAEAFPEEDELDC